ncbi:MAG: DUF1491 family protein [Rhodospirillaceae bacterium]|nr:DUF1491 family protein [Rhodospirillaceae bacterium]
MTESRLKTGLWAAALLRRWNGHTDVVATLVRRGDEDAGTVLLKISRLDGTATVLSQTTTMEGRRAWMRGTGVAPVAEVEAEAYIQRQRKRDPDLWVIEIEDRRGQFETDEPVV